MHQGIAVATVELEEEIVLTFELEGKV